MKIVYLTAGAAGMYCGSCMLDNALARAMIQQGHDAILVPIYTPIRTDEEDVSLDRVFMGGINVYLQQKLPWLRYLPRWFDSMLNQPWLIRRLTANTGRTSLKLLGSLSVSMLQGAQGKQRKEIFRLCDWLEKEIRPDVLLLTNLLIGGCIPEIKHRLNVPIFVTLQGDDIFLEAIPEPYRQQSIDAMRRLIPSIDGFIVHSHDYGQRMARLLQIPDDRWHVVPLGIDTHDFESAKNKPVESASSSLSTSDQLSSSQLSGAEPNRITLGYFARMAPEKGLHLLIDAFIELSRRPFNQDLHLRMAGWMGPQHADYWSEQKRKLHQAQLDHRWSYLGSIDRSDKVHFFGDIDLLSVPTTYREPKGLFVLEAAVNAVPYVQPSHGAFPELHQRLSAGWLFSANDFGAYVDQLQTAINEVRRRNDTPINDKEATVKLEAIRREVSIHQMATRVLKTITKVQETSWAITEKPRRGGAMSAQGEA